MKFPGFARSWCAQSPRQAQGNAGERDDRSDDPGSLHPQGAVKCRHHAAFE